MIGSGGVKAAKSKKKNKRRKDQPKNPPKAYSEPVNKVSFPDNFRCCVFCTEYVFFYMIDLGSSGGSCLCGSAQSG